MSKRLAILLTIAVVVPLTLVVLAWRAQRIVQRIEAVLPSGGGLREGSPVVYRGVFVGTIKRIWFEGDGVRMTLGLTRPVPVRTSDTLRVHTLGLLGDQVADITPGSASAPLLPTDSLLRGPAPSGPVTTDELRERIAREPPLRSTDSTSPRVPSP